MKFKCYNCRNKFEWEGDGNYSDIEKTGQQYITKEFWDNSGYKFIDNQLTLNGDKVNSSSILLMPRIYLCCECARKLDYIK